MVPYTAILSLGSNIKPRKVFLEKAIRSIRAFSKVQKISPLYETSPLGYTNQAPFINLCLFVKTQFEVQEFFTKCAAIEKSMKRQKKIHNGPRNIDIDLIFFDSTITNTSSLTIPHPRYHKRLFVLRPLLDIVPDFTCPVSRKTIKNIHDENDFKGQKIKKLPYLITLQHDT